MKHLKNALYLCSMAFLLPCLFPGGLMAQDVIILKTGDRIDGNIIEINDVEVKYREYNDPDGIIFTMSRGKIREIRYESGRREKEVPEELDKAYYVDDRKNALKLNFTGLAAATTTLIYERGITPGSSFEVAAKFNGLGFNNDEEKFGFGLAGAYKVKMGSLFKSRNTYRPKHYLAGGYLRPQLGFNSVRLEDGFDYNSYFYVHMGFDVGVQWVLQNALVFDMFIGWHYYGGNFDQRFSGDTGSGGLINDGNLFGGQNSAVSIGINIGGVFGKGELKKNDRRRR